MPDPTQHLDADASDVDDATESAPGMPGWVKVSVIVALILVLLVVVILLVGPGEHGPGRH